MYRVKPRTRFGLLSPELVAGCRFAYLRCAAGGGEAGLRSDEVRVEERHSAPMAVKGREIPPPALIYIRRHHVNRQSPWQRW
ncbi:hypothetical protein PBY51_009014 [Eleginops maclovinus]|uniref:Uncharacterized protein n=1 Tax=Eleginops maclovinus TaxID=56733 RepID=A0AAN7WXN1_ELEMC|nr:hypothetical protein PBY51_009014 [Eleginops maclovinus]